MVNLDWNNLGFDYLKTNCNIRCSFKDGKWSDIEICESEYINIHMSASCLHYGTELFEGLKAYRGVDGRVRLFRVADNAKRLKTSADRLCLESPSEDVIINACIEAVKQNIDFVPPYESGASLYLRPLLIGTSAGLGVKAAHEALFVVFVSPVGPYFKGGIKPISVLVDRDQDRAAPRGTGDVKVGGNYASSIFSGTKAHSLGYSNVMYLDPTEHKYIEECGAANFFGIKGNTYVTPKSPSILPSITNKSLRQIVSDMGYDVEERPVPTSELATFEECGACGTAAVISPIGKVVDLQTDEIFNFGAEVGPVCTKLYNALRDIQYGRAEDKHDWITIIE